MQKKARVANNGDGTFTAADITGPCYSAAMVSAANVVLFRAKDWTNPAANDILPPLLFCTHIPFVIMNAAGTVASGLTESPYTASDAPAAPPPPPPPMEPFNSPAVWYYTFCPGPDDSILISTYASTVPATVYWLYFTSSASAGIISHISPSLADVTGMGAHFGIVSVSGQVLSGPQNVLISYYDKTITTPCFVSLLSTTGYHGLDPANTRTLSSCVTYSSATMTSTTITCASFDGAAVLWGLVAAPFTSTHALQYMTQTCVGSSTSCANAHQSCTLFNDTTARGLACQAVASAAANTDPVTRDRAYAAACNMNLGLGTTLQAAVPEALAGAMQGPDCSCINYSQSTYPQPGLPQYYDYAGYEAWLLSNGLPSGDSGNVMCWWPSCQTPIPDPSILQYSNMATNMGKCPNTLTCINDIILAVADDSSDVVAVAKTSCGQNSPAGPSPSPSPAAPVTPTAPVSEDVVTKFFKSTAVRIAIGLVAYVLFLALLFMILKPKKRNIQYVVVDE